MSDDLKAAEARQKTEFDARLKLKAQSEARQTAELEARQQAKVKLGGQRAELDARLNAQAELDAKQKAELDARLKAALDASKKDLAGPTKDKLMITAYEVNEDGTVGTLSKDLSFTVMLNPATYKHDKSINYSGAGAANIPQGASAATPKFKNTGSEKLSFNITIDGTGALGVCSCSVSDQTEILNKVVYAYKGDTHEPNIVQVAWGDLFFTGRLTSMSTEYTLFSPDGKPLRAKITLAFTDYMSIREEALKANKSSPDLTHMVEVKAGDSLPLLCDRIYKNSAYYLEVAKANGITNFRNIKPGTRLNFPPLR